MQGYATHCSIDVIYVLGEYKQEEKKRLFLYNMLKPCQEISKKWAKIFKKEYF